jgi:hypothetical protein
VTKEKTMAKTYFVINEGTGILNPGGRGFRSLEKARELAAKAAEECSWTCQTPPAPDNEVSLGKGNFRCGVTAAHGIHIRTMEAGIWTGEYDVPDEKFQQSKGAGRHNDWHLNVIVDRGTGYLADGDTDEFFTGPEQTESSWNRIVEDIAGGDEVMEATVKPTPFGRYHHLADENYPLTWKDGGFE